MYKKLQLRRARMMWILLGFGIAGLVSTVCVAGPTGVWVDNPDHIIIKGTKVCADWESNGDPQYEGYCDIEPQYLGTGNLAACQEGFRHQHY